MEENELRHFVKQVSYLLEPELIAYVEEWFPDFIEELAKECLLLKTEGKTREQIVDTLEKEHDETRKFGRLLEKGKFPPTWQGISFGGTSFHVCGYWKPPANIFHKVLTLCLDIIAPIPPKIKRPRGRPLKRYYPVEEWKKMREKGMSIRKIASETGVPKSTVHRKLSQK